MKIRKEISKIVLPITYHQVFPTAWSNYGHLLNSQWDHKEKILNNQFAKIQTIINHAYQNVPFYKVLFDKNRINPRDIRSIEDFKKLPIISKKNFLEYKKEECTAHNIPKNRIMYQSTSGSTGSPFEYAADRAELGIRHLIQFRSFTWAGWDVGDKYVYFDGMIGGDGVHPLVYKMYLTYTNFFTRRLHISSLQVNSEVGMRKYLDKVVKYKPKIIRTTVSQIRLIMKFVKDNSYPFPSIPLVTVGETLTIDDRKSIKEILNCDVFESYGAGEFCGAYECNQHMGLHVSDESVYLEVINNGRDTKENEQGNIIITNLNNYAWPFIRYDMGDLGVREFRKCKCGRQSTFLKEISGRVSEFVITTDNKLLGLHDFTQIIGQNVQFIKQWQILQEKIGRVKVIIVPTGILDEEGKKKIIRDIAIAANNKIDAEIEIVSEIPAGRTGKRHLIRSNISKS
jgi:phenylacetate-CoA ligase